jgi:ABC-type glycerol-3-phosphate transport system permease component
MPIILKTERRSAKSRLTIGAIYVLLAFGGVTMIYPFLITVSSSMTNAFEYNRFIPCPRSLYDRSDRFVRSLVAYFEGAPSAHVFKDLPRTWASWTSAGTDPRLVRRFAERYLAIEDRPAELERWRRAAADFALFSLDYDIRDTTCRYDARDLAGFLEARYARAYVAKHPEAARFSASRRRPLALSELRSDWDIPYTSFFDVTLANERWYPMHHPTWNYPATAQARLYLEFKDAYRRMAFEPGAERQWCAFAKGRGLLLDRTSAWPVDRDDPQWPLFKEFVAETCPASPTLPFLMKAQWCAFFNRAEAKALVGLDAKAEFTVVDYNRLCGSRYEYLQDIPFPVPADTTGTLRELWGLFVVKYYPRRLLTVTVTPELQTRYQASLRETYKTMAVYNTLSSTNIADFSDIPLQDSDTANGDWLKFVGSIPAADFRLRSAEGAYQQFLLSKYGSVAAINAAYGWKLRIIEEASPPMAEAMTVTFFNNEWRHFRHDIAGNYGAVFEFMAIRGRAFVNTVIYISICLLLSLTINPLSAYALSRFKLRWTEQILLFMLATMAFPGAVTAIPSFLLLRDLQLLNTFYALFLPGLANGMAIFILKCFFDGLPRELYEAATIDGAREWQIFLHISLPMTTPILAVNALNAFIGAYNSWEWALIVCQKESYWTIAVWLYQLSQTLGGSPWVIMAAFVAASIPTALVFIGCQKIILRGIVLPSMK